MAFVASAPLVLPFNAIDLPLEKRREYLRKLWNADVDAIVFLGAARKLGYALGYALGGRWDAATDMPALVPTIRLLH
ncbi:Uncharacterised protein [Burkholderia pseudomallei]|uniref:hypothetical protein n=1 Tax=Burkholderia pseudomallei TaxID=28450 RepID=UPI000055BD11|nr:hypothetical protein [Burkholderia pseudomallei]EDS86565.1 hypothetical protein BURPSS13_G0035 [Burkholderia pseudomallei S13]CAJ9760864.1 Uncharacterised protein [Burkholderia pseudomallei]CAK0036380.1 Uncharacterised protein [Burkholderia pseudomallei]CAK0172160.1 Uncharacterised protein [Burkholderia pseudomallei]CFL73009.1 Uncharacterised protein [Burkholderia pseudomallei]